MSFSSELSKNKCLATMKFIGYKNLIVVVDITYTKGSSINDVTVLGNGVGSRVL